MEAISSLPFIGITCEGFRVNELLKEGVSTVPDYDQFTDKGFTTESLSLEKVIQ